MPRVRPTTIMCYLIAIAIVGLPRGDSAGGLRGDTVGGLRSDSPRGLRSDTVVSPSSNDSPDPATRGAAGHLKEARHLMESSRLVSSKPTSSTMVDGWRRTSEGWKWYPTSVVTQDLSETIVASRTSFDVESRSSGFFQSIWPAAFAAAQCLLILWCFEKGATQVD